MRHLDLFSGIGGFALAAQWTWGDDYINVGHSEVEPFACKVYHKHFESECLGDITKIEWKEGQADLITGGFPCQPHSIAGKRKASADERDLWGECIRALRGVRPKYALFENVPDLLTSERGRFFNRVLSDLAKQGYNVRWEIISACSLGFPHTRERVWLLTYTVKTRWDDVGEIFSHSTTKESWQASEKKLANTSEQWLLTQGNVRDVRKDDGIPEAMDRIASLGNAIVPQVAQVIMEKIKKYDLSSKK